MKKNRPAVVHPPIRVAAPAVARTAAPPQAAQPRPSRSKVVEDGLLSVISRQQKFLAAFPFLKGFADAVQNCYSCAGRREVAKVSARMRSALATLDDTQKKKLKALLNTESVTIYIADTQGRRAVTF